MNQRNHALQVLIYSCLFFAPSLASLEQGGTQLISYNGTIEGRFEHPSSAPSNCSTYYFGSLENSFLQVGANPPWDSNAFYFNVKHAGETVSSHNGSCFNPTPGGCTLDPIYNLMFRTADYLCYADKGGLCGAIEYKYHFVPTEMINLNRSTTKQIASKNEKGYSVVGDQSSFRNGSVPNAFDFQIPNNYTSHRGCAAELRFQWNSTTPFEYAVNFTNTTAEARFTLQSSQGTVAFWFSGNRVDAVDKRENSRVDRYNDGAYTPTSLNTSDPSMPKFNFVNGSDFQWRNSSRGIWHATPPKSLAVSVFDGNAGVLNCIFVMITTFFLLS